MYFNSIYRFEDKIIINGICLLKYCNKNNKCVLILGLHGIKSSLRLFGKSYHQLCKIGGVTWQKHGLSLADTFDAFLFDKVARSLD